MKKTILFFIIITGSLISFGATVQMNDGIKYEGNFVAKLNNYIYLSDEIMIYELPIKDIEKIVINGRNKTEESLKKEDFRKINITDKKFYIYSHNNREEKKSNYINSKDIFLAMSDREFEIYKLNQQQKQAELVAKKMDRMSNTMWSIWGVSIGLGLVVAISLNL